MLKYRAYILLFLLCSLLGFSSGLLFTILSGTAKEQGLAAGGILVFNAAVGMILGIAIAIITTTKVDKGHIPKTTIVMAVLNIVLITILILKIKLKT